MFKEKESNTEQCLQHNLCQLHCHVTNVCAW